MSQSPVPGWYADPQGLADLRWWDGLTWTAHTTGAQPAAPAFPAAASLPAAQQGFYGGPATPGFAGTARPTQYRPAPAVSGWRRNECAFITMGVVAAYILIALKAHVYVLGVLPVMMSIRSKSRNEPLAVAAIIAAVVAVVVAILGFTGH